MSEELVTSSLENLLDGVTFYNTQTYPNQLYEQTGMDVSQQPSGTYVGAVRNHRLAGVSLIMLFGVYNMPNTFQPSMSSGQLTPWSRLCVRPTTSNAESILSNKTLSYDETLKNVEATFANTERGMQHYIVGNLNIFVKVRGHNHSGFRANLHGLLHHSDQIVITRPNGSVPMANFGNTPYTFSNYSGRILHDGDMNYAVNGMTQ